MKNGKRIQSFEGLRGIMAIAVLNCHVMGLFPLFGQSAVGKVLLHTPLFIFISGGFGVSYFFVLSSFGFCFNNYERDFKSIIIGYIKRYFRLVPTLMMSDFVVLFLVRNGFYYLMPGWFDDAGLFQFSIYIDKSRTVFEVIKDSVWDIFVLGLPKYVPPFWTIQLEMLGGGIAIIILLAIRNKTYIYKFIIILFAFVGISFLKNSYYYSTLAGVILCEIVRCFRKKEI